MKIVDTDAFTDMPNDAQLLYFRLCLAADDDGFVSSPRKVMRSTGIGEDSMKILISKKFVLVLKYNENVILLIKHWKMHNTIKNDRYQPSPYHELLQYVYLDKNKAYSLTPGEGKYPALPAHSENGSQMDPNVIQIGSSDKDRLEESRLEEDSKDIEKNSVDQSIGKGGTGEKPLLTGQDRIDRIKEHAKRVDIFVSHHFDPQGIYKLADLEGIKREEIDACREGGI